MWSVEDGVIVCSAAGSWPALETLLSVLMSQPPVQNAWRERGRETAKTDKCLHGSYS